MAQKGWPEVAPPAPMDPDELEAILFALGNAYGEPFKQVPPGILAPALGLSSTRQIARWRAGQTPIPPLVAKTLRLFHSQSRIF